MNPLHALLALVGQHQAQAPQHLTNAGPAQALRSALQAHQAQSPQLFNQGADITYNPNPRTDIPNSVHSMQQAQALAGHAQAQAPRGNLGVPTGYQPQGYSQVQRPGAGAYNPGAIPLQGTKGYGGPQFGANYVPHSMNPQNAPTQQYWN